MSPKSATNSYSISYETTAGGSRPTCVGESRAPYAPASRPRLRLIKPAPCDTPAPNDTAARNDAAAHIRAHTSSTDDHFDASRLLPSKHPHAARTLDAFARLSSARATALVQQCYLLWHVREKKVFQERGYRNLADFAREVLRISPRTARRRLRVARVLIDHPSVEDALLSGPLSVCQVDTLAPVLTKDLPSTELLLWMVTAHTHSIQELRRLVKEAATPDHRPEQELRVQIRVPASAAQAFDHAVHAARRELGWDASPSECFEAILAEAESSLCGAGSLSASLVDRRKFASNAEAYWHENTEWSGSAFKRGTPSSPESSMSGLLEMLDDELSEIEDLCRSEPSDNQPSDPVKQFILLEQSLRPLALLEGRLLFHMRTYFAPMDFEQFTWEDVATNTLRMSARRFRELVRNAKLLRKQGLERVYVKGQLSLSHLRLIMRLEGDDHEQNAWIQRARCVTFRQLAREIDLADKLSHLREPLPWDPTGNLAQSNPGLPDSATDFPEFTTDLPDPAVDPQFLEQMEARVHARLMQDFPSGVGRQTLATFGPSTAITLYVSEDVMEQWVRLRDAVRAAMRGTVPGRERPPDWVCLVQILNLALSEWSAHEGKPRTLAHRIVQRDDYHCTAPGCSQRRRLEAHHIVFRSRGGSDDPGNLTTLCAFHHRFAIHGGVIQLTGSARGDLWWHMPQQQFHGNFRLTAVP